MTAALEGGEWSASLPDCTLPPGKTRYPFYRRLGGTQGRSGWAENLVPTGIRSQDRPARSSVAIPTGLTGPRSNECIFNFTLGIIAFYQLAWVCRIITEKLTIVASSVSDGSSSTVNTHSAFFLIQGIRNSMPRKIYSWYTKQNNG